MVTIARVAEFIAAAQAAGAEVHCFGQAEDAFSFVLDILGEQGEPSLLVAPDLLEAWPDTGRLPWLRAAKKEEWMTAEISLVRADYGLAQTGTLVHLDRTEEERLAWTLPSVCLCLLSARSIVVKAGELAPVIAHHLGRQDLPAPDVSFITGPSRTADIEGEIVCGVHGPKRVIILLLENPPGPADETGE